MEYIEKDCFSENGDKQFEATRAYVNPDYIVAYLGQAQWSDSWGLLHIPHGDLTDWPGNKLGTYRITSTWKTRPYGDKMHQVYAMVDGVTYTGRSQ
jgi:hypothetical protein